MIKISIEKKFIQPKMSGLQLPPYNNSGFVFCFRPVIFLGKCFHSRLRPKSSRWHLARYQIHRSKTTFRQITFNITIFLMISI